jgi:5'-methylthioadenosine phosphorylase/5'-methylthioinosine phosphorylase
LPPHRVNYRANIWALKACGAERVLGLAAVGGIGPAYKPGAIVVPDQIIDYSHGRASTFFDGGDVGALETDSPDADRRFPEETLRTSTPTANPALMHIDFTRPYCEALRRALLDVAPEAGMVPIDGGTYGVTQGPRLETAAEIRRMERDGCDMVGMTGMPEAALARELDLCYACCAFVVTPSLSTGRRARPEVRF